MLRWGRRGGACRCRRGAYFWDGGHGTPAVRNAVFRLGGRFFTWAATPAAAAPGRNRNPPEGLGWLLRGIPVWILVPLRGRTAGVDISLLGTAFSTLVSHMGNVWAGVPCPPVSAAPQAWGPGGGVCVGRCGKGGTCGKKFPPGSPYGPDGGNMVMQD